MASNVIAFRKTDEAKANVQALTDKLKSDNATAQQKADEAYEMKRFHEDELARLKACLERLYAVSGDVRRTKVLAERAVADQSRKYGI